MRRAYRCVAVALTATLLCLLWARPGGAAPLNDHYRLWAKVTFDAINWTAEINQLTLAEGLEIGGSGYIYDPYIVGFRAEAGLIDYHYNLSGDWSTSIGWRALVMLNFVPASKFPFDLYVSRSALGLRPGANPALNLTNSTNIGGNWSLLFVGWPRVYLKSNYTITDYNLGPGLAQPLFGEVLEQYTETRLRAEAVVTRSTKVHSYDMRLQLFDDVDSRTDRRLRRGRFWVTDRALLSDELQIQGSVIGEVGELTYDSAGTNTSFSEYRAAFYLIYAAPRVLRLTTRTNFFQSHFGEARQLGGDVTTEAYWTPRKWVELFAGVALTYLDEQLVEQLQREAREQVGLGARFFVGVPGVGGRLEAKLLGRIGGGQALDLGSGLFVSVDSYARWVRPISSFVEMYFFGRALYTRDRSPLGVDYASYEARLGLNRAGTARYNLQGFGFINHRKQEEVGQGSFTDTYTEAGGQFLMTFRPMPWLQGAVSGTYSRFLESELGAQSAVTGLAQITAVPTESLRFLGRASYSGRIQEGELFSSTRIEAEVSWRLRQLTVDASYIFLLDDYRGLPKGDHRAMLRLVRTFDIRFGGRKR